MKHLNFFRRALPFLALLLMLPATMWGATYTRVESAPTDWSGKYLLVGTNTSNGTTTYYAWDGTFGSWGTCVALTAEISTDKKTITSTSSSKFKPMVFAKSGSGYTIKCGDDYLAATDKKFNSNTSAVVYTVLDISNDGKAKIQKSSSGDLYGIRYNYNNGSGGFRIYKNGTTAEAFYLYREQTSTKSRVTLNTNGGTINSGNITEYIEGTGATLPSDVTKTGFSFDGWFDNSAFTGSAVTAISTSDKGDKEFWAKWTSLATEAYTVTFNGNGKGTPAENSLKEVSAGAGVTLPDCEANEGWVFKGWATTADATTVNAGVTGDIYHPTSDNTPLYAFYKVKPATPSFDPVAGAIDKGDGVSISCTTDGASIYYTLDGTTPSSASSAYSSAIVITEEKTIKAIAVLDGESSDVATAEYTIATHTVHFSVNGNIDNTKDFEGAKGAAITFPAEDPEVDGVSFMGWASSPITGTLSDAPDMVTKANEKIGTDDVTYYAVFAVPNGQGDPTFTKLTALDQLSAGDNIVIVAKQDDTHYFALYQETANSTYVAKKDLSAEPTIEYLNDKDAKKYVTFSASTTEGQWYIGDATNGYLYSSASTNLAVSADNKSSWVISYNATNKYFQAKYDTRFLSARTDLAASNAYKDYFRLGGASNGIVQLQFYRYGGGDTQYSDYCTTVALDPQPTIVLGAITLTEYAGNTNNSISASVTEQAYTGTLEASSDKEAVATASISDGKVVINALTAGTANITITAPAVTGFRKSTATIAVTVENKKAANLVFAETTQTVSMDAEPFAALTIASMATDAETVTYSLDIKGDATGTPIASLEMIEGVPTITLSGTKATTDTRTIDVVATTEETHTYAAGEARYQLIVTKRDPQIAWSAASVTLDLNEEDKLPSLSNPRNLTITYNSTNKEVADFNEGVLELKKAGTTTIQASIGSSGYYDATTVSYELTFAPRYTVTFKVFGQDDVVLREETFGAGVTAPTVSSMGSKVFRGWAEEEIDGTTDIAPTFVTTANLDDNKILYAVFATQTQSSSEGSSTLTADAIAENIMAKKMAYSDAERSYDDGTITWAVRGYAENDESSYIQIKKDAGTYIKIAAPGAIANVSFDITTAANSNFTGGVYLTTNPTGDPANDSNVKGSVSLSAEKIGTISTISGSNNTLYIQVGSAARLSNVAVTYGTPAVYSAYCTSITSCEIALTTSGDYGFSTFCGSANYTVEGADAYKASVMNDKLVLTKLEGVIPAGNDNYENGVVIAGPRGETATIHYTTKKADADMDGNQLLGTLAVTLAADLKGDATYLMVFSKSKGGFVSYTGTDVPAYKACLPYNSPEGGAPGAPMRMVFGRDNLPTNNVNVNVNDNQGTKVMIDGRLYILRDGKTYDSFGRLVK